ncbi:uncharacterized protein LOC126195157 [Schistocerca nitens]|uniref:uncharacterized protein LOC126195157 n=1 Tax=Schistocerca nitens TaxID=7011 RepID=UPI0021188DF9|nr:uncharacterized protein LOC126195157 [Schistocerca nitens]
MDMGNTSEPRSILSGIRSAEDCIKYGFYRIEALERNLRSRHLSSDERQRIEGELEEVKEELKRNQHELKHLQKENTKSFAMAAILMFLCFLVFGVYKMLQNKQ